MADDLPTTLAGAFKQALVDAHHETVDHAHDKATAARTAQMETWEQELAATIKEIGLLDMTDPSIPEPIRKLFAPINKPENQSDFFFALAAGIGLLFVGSAAAAAGPAQIMQNTSFEKWGDLYPDPGTDASLVARRLLTQTEGEGWAATTGMRPNRFGKLVDAAYNHMGPSELITLIRRDYAYRPDARLILQRQGYPDAEIDKLLELVIGPIDFATAVAAVTQSQITPQVFRELLPDYGISAEWADVIFKTAGASPSVQETLELWNRGLIDEPTVDKIILESPIKNEYVPVLKLMRHRFPALEQTTTLMRKKVMTLEEGKDAIRKLGYEPSLADKIAESIVQGGGGATKNLTPSVILDLYEVGKFTAGDATTHLTAMGYDATEADLLLFLADEKKSHSATDRAATSIGTRYVSWKIDRALAVTLLDQVNVPAAQRDELLDIWDARREAQTLHLSEAFLHKAFKLGNITAGEVEKRLLAMGYDATDTAIIMATDFAEAAPKPKTKDLTRADETKRYKAGIIDAATFKGRLVNAGYDATEADQILELVDHDVAAAAAKETAGNGA